MRRSYWTRPKVPADLSCLAYLYILVLVMVQCKNIGEKNIMAYSYYISNRPLKIFQLGTVLVLAIGIFRKSELVNNYFKLKKSSAVLENTVTQIEAENSALHSEVEKLIKSPEYIRRTLRDKYHITEEGEKIFFFAE